MKAMLLAAGRGSRLKDIGKSTPKCLLEVGGLTLIERVVEHLKAVGVTGIVVNLHHLADQVESFIRSRDFFGIDLQFSYEAELMDTGGGIKHAREFLFEEDFFIVHNADIYSEIDLSALLEFHQERQPLVTLAVRSCETQRGLLCSSSNVIVGWVNDDTGRRSEVVGSDTTKKVTFTGVHVASRKVFQFFEREENCFSIFTPYMKAAAAGELLGAYDASAAYWIDVGTPERLAELKQRLEG